MKEDKHNREKTISIEEYNKGRAGTLWARV